MTCEAIEAVERVDRTPKGACHPVERQSVFVEVMGSVRVVARPLEGDLDTVKV